VEVHVDEPLAGLGAGGSGEIALKVGSGDVRVTGEGLRKARVVGTVRFFGPDAAAKSAQGPDAWRHAQVDLDVEVAYGADVAIDTASADVTVHGHLGAFSFNSKSGEADVVASVNFVHLVSMSGGLSVAGVVPRATLRSKSGLIIMHSPPDTFYGLANVTADTMSGHVHLVRCTGTARTKSGDVHLEGCRDVAASSVSGRVIEAQQVPVAVVVTAPAGEDDKGVPEAVAVPAQPEEVDEWWS
jgi:hypothetical protein